MKTWVVPALVCGLLSVPERLPADPFAIHGVTFPGGITSFADAVVENYWPVNGGPDAGFDDPATTLGIPDYLDVFHSFYSLGDGGYLIVEFKDNFLTVNGDSSDDLYIFAGPNADWETAMVDISKDGTNWIPAGLVSEVDGGLNLDSLALGADPRFSFVKITDTPGQGDTYSPSIGFDLDAVGAISSIAIVPPTPIPEPATLLLVGAGLALAGLKRRRCR